MNLSSALQVGRRPTLRSRLLQSAQVTTAGIGEPNPPQHRHHNLRRRPGHHHFVEGGALPKSPFENWVRRRGFVDVSGVAWEVVAELFQQVPSLYRTVLLFLSPLLVLSPVVIAAVSVSIPVATSVVKH